MASLMLVVRLSPLLVLAVIDDTAYGAVVNVVNGSEYLQLVLLSTAEAGKYSEDSAEQF